MLKTLENIFQILQTPDRHLGDNLVIVDGDIKLTYRQVYLRIGLSVNFLRAQDL